MFMNQLWIIWGYQEDLSSTAVRPRADGKARIATPVRCRVLDPKTASRSPCAPIGAVARLLSESESKTHPRDSACQQALVSRPYKSESLSLGPNSISSNLIDDFIPDHAGRG